MSQHAGASSRRVKKSVLIFLLSFLAFAMSILNPGEAPGQQTARNVILMIVDGCGSEQYTLARWVKGAPLSLDRICVGAVKTYIADSVVADSAPAASAYATGHRTSDKHISVGPGPQTLSTVPAPLPEMMYRPLATILEGARKKGMATGIVSTSRVTHATPAAFYAHVPDRDMEEDIMEQAVYQNLDLVFGGGKALLLPTSGNGRRSDGEDLMAVLKQMGYRVIENRMELRALTSGKVFGMFASNHMEPELDRPAFAPQEPTLEEMTRKAVEILSMSPNGFFLMVEASQVDWACHANDPAHLIGDLSMYDRAVQAALEFAEKNGETLVVAVSDHNTGGMSIGNSATSASYSQMKLGAMAGPVSAGTLLGPLGRMNLTAYGIWRNMGKDANRAGLQGLVAKHWGMDITDEEADQIIALSRKYPKVPYWGLGEVLSARYTCIGWSTHGHTGGDVPLFAYGPGRPVGLVDAPDLGRRLAQAMGIDLAGLTRRLYVEAHALFPGKVSIEKNGGGLTATITLPDKTAELPVNKNILRLGGRSTELEGIVVHSPKTGRVYIPEQAVQLLKTPGK